MPVFNAYFRVTKKYLVSLLVYFVIFIFMTVIFTQFLGGQTSYDFSAVRTNVIVQSEENTPLTEGLKSYLGRNAEIVTVGNGADSAQDALFFGKADYILRIPAGFTERFMSGSNTASLEKTTGALSGSTVSMDLLVNKYFNLARLYVVNVPGISQNELVRYVSNDLVKSSPVTVNIGENQVKTGGLNVTFRFVGYAVMGILLTGIMSIMIAFNDPELSRRNLCAPVKPTRMNLQLFLGNTCLMILVWAVLCLVSLPLSRQKDFGPGYLLLCLNTFVFSACTLTIAFLAGKFAKSQIALAAFTNIVSLGVSFLSGIFVPQNLLGASVQKVASLTPGYWYVKAVDTITGLSVITFDGLKPVLGDMLIQLGFAAACLIIALVVTKQKKQSNESYVL